MGEDHHTGNWLTHPITALVLRIVLGCVGGKPGGHLFAVGGAVKWQSAGVGSVDAGKYSDIERLDGGFYWGPWY
jgi:hypothetical protein